MIYIYPARPDRNEKDQEWPETAATALPALPFIPFICFGTPSCAAKSPENILPVKRPAAKRLRPTPASAPV